MNLPSTTLPAGAIDAALETIDRTTRRDQLLWTGFLVLALASLGFSGWVWLNREVALVSALAPLLTQLAGLALLAVLLRSAWRRRRHYRGLSQNTRTVVQQSRAATGTAIRQQRRLVLGAWLVIVPLLELAQWSLLAEGKMRAADVGWLSLLVIIAAGAVTAVARHRIQRERHWQEQLQRLSAELERTGDAS